jgi:predicted membrane-bound spermidine synthase
MEVALTGNRWLRRGLALVFAASGFSALVYQVAWQRVLTQAIGSDAISVVLVVTTFMACLGLGAELARRLLSRPGLPLALAYAAIEFAIGVYGVASVPLLRHVNALWAAADHSSLAADAVINFLVLAPPIIGMGMTTPLIVQLAKNRLHDLGRTVGLLYGLNIFGAAVGALATGLVLIEWLGLRGVTILAAFVNFLIAGALFLMFRRSAARSPDEVAVPAAQIPWGPALACLAFGFGTLAIQVGLLRVLSNYFTLATIVFPAALAAYLALMGAGQALGGALADRNAGHLPTVVGALFFAGAALLLASLRFPPAWAAPLGALAFTSFNGSLIEATHPELIGDPNPLVVFLFGAAFMLSVLAWSALFPVMLRMVTKDVARAGQSFAQLYALYTIGNVIGAFAFGLWMLPWLGTGGGLAATIVIVAVGVLCAAAGKPSRAWLLAVAGVACATLIPLDYYKQFRLGTYAVAKVYEGRTGVATLVPTKRFYNIVDMNRTASASAISRDPVAPDDQYEAWRWNHTELFALDPGFRPQNVLIIGIGHAYLVDALLDLPFIKKITIVDISQEVVDAVRDNTRTSTRRVFTDPRVRVVIADGRRFVQQALAHGEHYDLIQTKITEPWHAGGGNLFTVEFMRMQRALLTPGGYLGTRPLAGHVRDGLEVFGAAIYPGYYHVYFKNGPLPNLRVAMVTPDIRDAWFRALPGRNGVTSRKPFLSVVAVTDKSAFSGLDSNTDDRPTFEYYWLRQRLGVWRSPRVALSDAVFDPLRRDVPVQSQAVH